MLTDELGLQSAWTDVRALLPGWLAKTKVGATPAEEIFKRGNLRLLKYRDLAARPRTAYRDLAPRPRTAPGNPAATGTAAAERTPIVIVPSLINRHYILDLLPQRSLVEAFLEAGFPVYMMAWGAPPAEDRYLTIEQLFRQRILKAIEKTGAAKVHLVGQCLGGTIATIAAHLAPEKIASLSLLTAPIDFEKAGQLGAWANAPGFDVDALVDAYGNIPASLLQTSFQFLKPSMPLTKYTKLFSKRKDEEFLINFFAMEMWANDAIGFPGLCYKFLIEDLYRANKLAKNEVVIGGRRIDLTESPFPILDAMANDDHIVPPETRIRAGKKFDLAGGHIGGVIGSQARKKFWPQWIQWLYEQT